MKINDIAIFFEAAKQEIDFILEIKKDWENQSPIPAVTIFYLIPKKKNITIPNMKRELTTGEKNTILQFFSKLQNRKSNLHVH